ncbi:hypothetical protein BDZ90DRAFT_229513 [Jaminaea rosea]|uniref:cysteine desulfurase n=1 Tax=Jaminaea rosea TaxID=1569628 RepID=A0A316V0H4_9BASI|nr:hypothetical protein BDZ90DRAFT_229513 [Jaminaea rosea]PWN30498.1 hypothetical protein BDZ90DRAFT_229513 [Jaminaea rosea]
MIAPSVRQALVRNGAKSTQRIAAAATAPSSSPPAATRGYATPSKPNQMATPVEVQSTVSAGRGSAQRNIKSVGGGHRDLVSDVLESAPRPSTAKRPIYLDAQATTPVDPRVLDAMMPFYTNQYGNPHSRTHAYGWESEAAVEAAREHIADLIGADSKEIIFTSGATESNNMALKGCAHFYGSKKNHIITTQTEHKCVLDSCRKLQDEGFEVTYLPVKENGLIDMKELEDALRPETAVVSIMTVNNEIGVIQPIAEIGKLLKTKGAELAKSKGLSGKPLLHTDGAQAAGKIPIDVNKMNVDLMSLSSHKIYGPKGMGAIYVRRRPRVRLEPIINGGGQERGLRSGTLAPPLIVGFGEAARIAKRELAVSTRGKMVARGLGRRSRDGSYCKC